MNMMLSNDHSSASDKITVSDTLKALGSDIDSLSSKDISAIIALLETKQKEKEEQERQQRIEEKRTERIRREQEKKDREEEHIRTVTTMELPLDWENIYDDDEETKDIHVDSIGDGLIKCLNRFARVDIEYISAITGADYKTVIETLKGSIYQNPDTWGECFFKGWETAEEYLSGNILEKLRTAQKSNFTYHGYFADNVEALNSIAPSTLSAKEIYVTLGSPWVPVKYINDFANHLTRNKRSSVPWVDKNTLIAL